MVSGGINQWKPGQVSISWVLDKIERGSLWMARLEDQVVGSVTIVGQDPQIWGETDEPAGYVHGLMIDRAWSGQGIGRAILTWAERHIAASGCRRVRLDCVASNSRLRVYYEESGYSLVREKALGPRWDPAALFEKQVAPE